MFLFIVTCVAITLLTLITICLDIAKHKFKALCLYVVICIFSYAVWIYRFIVDGPIVVIELHDILWESVDFYLIVIAIIVIIMCQILTSLCEIFGLKVLLFLAFVICTHPLVMLVIHICMIVSFFDDGGSTSSSSNDNDDDKSSYPSGDYCGAYESEKSPYNKGATFHGNSCGELVGSNGVTYHGNSCGELVGSDGVIFHENSCGEWVGSNGVTYHENSCGEWVGSDGGKFHQNSCGEWVSD